MGLFRRKKKAENERGKMPSSEVKQSAWKEYSTRQEEGGTKMNIHETSPIMSKGSGSLPKPTVGIINDILSEEKIIQTANKARSLIDGGKYQEALEFCEKIISMDKDNLSIWLQKSSTLFNLKRYEESNECEDVILRLIQKISKTDKDFFQTLTPAKQRSLSLHTKATNYYFMIGKFPYSEVGISVAKAYVEKAKKCLLEVLELDPYNEEALEDLHDIEKKDGLAERVKVAEAQKKTEKNSSSIPTAEKSSFIPSQESESDFCENCGKSLEPTTKFCGKCGTPRA